MKKTIKFIGLIICSIICIIFLSVTVFAETEGIFTYTVSNNEATITDVDTNVTGNVIIPSELGGYTVTTIANQSFDYCFSIEELYIPETVKLIEDRAFINMGCQKFTVDINNEYYSNDDFGVLFNKEKTIILRYPILSETESYTVPDTVTQFQGRPFQYCMNNLLSVTLPEGLKSLSECAFLEASSIITVNLPQSLEKIDANCFAMCYSLKNITIPSNVKTIEMSAFTYCHSLRTFTFPDGIETATTFVLSDCNSLERIFIPESVTTIDNRAFGGCPSLTTIYYGGTEEQWNAITNKTSDIEYNATFTSAQKIYNYDGYLNSNTDTYMSENIVYIEGNSVINSGNDSWYYWNEYADDAQVIIIDGEFTAVESGVFSNFPNVTTIIIYPESIIFDDGAFNTLPLLENVIDFGNSSFSGNTFTSTGSVQLFTTNKNASDINNCRIIPFEFNDNSLHFAGEVNVDSHTFFDIISAMSLEYEAINTIKFDNFTCEDITFYYYDAENYSYTPIDGNTLENAVFSVFLDSYETGRVDITFNKLCNGIADGTITDFYLVAEDTVHDEMLDTEIEVKDEEQEEESFIVRALKWIVSLFNKLFKLLSRLR